MLLEFIRVWAAPLVLLLNTGFGVVIWLIRPHLVTHTDLAEVSESAVELTRRLERLEMARESSITREDLMGLRLEMETMRGDMRTHSSRIRALKRQSQAEIATARALLERSERGLEMIHEYLLNQVK